MTKLVPAPPDTSVRSTVEGRWDAREGKCAVPMARLDVMASPRPIYLRCPAWSAQGAQEKGHGVRGRWCELEVRGCQERDVLFLHHHIVASATAARRCLFLFKAVSGCGERKERNERGRPECRGSPGMGILRARRNGGDGRRECSIRRGVRLTKAQAQAQAVVRQGGCVDWCGQSRCSWAGWNSGRILMALRDGPGVVMRCGANAWPVVLVCGR